MQERKIQSDIIGEMEAVPLFLAKQVMPEKPAMSGSIYKVRLRSQSNLDSIFSQKWNEQKFY